MVTGACLHTTQTDPHLLARCALLEVHGRAAALRAAQPPLVHGHGVACRPVEGTVHACFNASVKAAEGPPSIDGRVKAATSCWLGLLQLAKHAATTTGC